MKARDVAFLLAVVGLAGWCLRKDPTIWHPGDYPFTVDGVRLGESGEEIQERWGRPVLQLPRQDKKPGPVLHRHIYRTGLDVEFDDSLFTALNIRGHQLEFEGRPILRAGEPIEQLSLPLSQPLKMMRLEEILSEREAPPDGVSSFSLEGGYSLRSIHVCRRQGKILYFVLNQLY